MVWTICRIILVIALLVGYIYYEYKWMLRHFRSPDVQSDKITKESLLPPVFMGGLVGLTMESFDKWLEPHIASEGARFFLFMLILIIFTCVCLAVIKRIVKRKIEKDCEVNK